MAHQALLMWAAQLFPPLNCRTSFNSSLFFGRRCFFFLVFLSLSIFFFHFFLVLQSIFFFSSWCPRNGGRGRLCMSLHRQASWPVRTQEYSPEARGRPPSSPPIAGLKKGRHGELSPGRTKVWEGLTGRQALLLLTGPYPGIKPGTN